MSFIIYSHGSGGHSIVILSAYLHRLSDGENSMGVNSSKKYQVSIIRKYHNYKLQTTPWHREEEPLNHHETPGRQIKQSNQLSLPHQDDCNTRMDIK